MTCATPVVDVQNVPRAQVFTGETFDAATGRVEQTYVAVNGSRDSDTTMKAAGVKPNSLMTDGRAQVRPRTSTGRTS